MLHHVILYMFRSVIPLLWVGVFAGMIVLRHRRKIAEIALLGAGGSAGSSVANSITHPADYPIAQGADRREIEALRERVRVLERIATDNHRRHALSDEIDALRDPEMRD